MLLAPNPTRHIFAPCPISSTRPPRKPPTAIPAKDIEVLEGAGAGSPPSRNVCRGHRRARAPSPRRRRSSTTPWTRR
jgi:hypothetical protein